MIKDKIIYYICKIFNIYVILKSTKKMPKVSFLKLLVHWKEWLVY